MEQPSIPFVTQKDEIANETILKCKNFKAALRLCIEVAGLPLKEVSFAVDIHEKFLSRMLTENDEDQRHFPMEKLGVLMNICQNEIPLRWLALSRGYGLYRLKTALELEVEKLKTELEQERKERQIILKAFKEVHH